MALPLPKVVADVEKGGPFVTSMRGLNQLRDEQLQTEINRVKAKYAPLTTQAEAASKLAYSNLMGPQFLAKLARNPDIMANLSEEQKRSILERARSAGMQEGVGNALNSMPSNDTPPNSIAGGLFDYLKNKIMPQQNNAQQSSTTNPFAQTNQQQPAANPLASQGSGMMMPEHPEQRKLEELASKPLYNPTQSTYSENAGRQAGIQKEGELLGTERGKAISDLGKEQLALSSSDNVLDHITGIIQNPTFNSMRDKIPFFQDKQLAYLSKTGTKEEQELIGDFISSAQAYKASTVNSFKGKALEKEFGLADKIKIDENDTMGVAQGKLRALKTLKEIAQTKNDFVIGLMTDEHMNLGDAVKRANKLVNTKSIEKKVDDILKPPITIMYKNNEQYHIPTDQVEAAKKAGYSNGR